MPVLDQFRSKLILQLVEGISRVLQFVSPVIFPLLLNESVVALAALKSTILSLAGFKAGTSHKIPDVFE